MRVFRSLFGCCIAKSDDTFPDPESIKKKKLNIERILPEEQEEDKRAMTIESKHFVSHD